LLLYVVGRRLGQWTNPIACRVRTQIQRVVLPTVGFREFKQTMAYDFVV